jgi:hypothetical protein
MSIEMDNPKTIMELIDAASNHVAQIRIALMIGDLRKAEDSIDRSSELLAKALSKCEEEGIS